MLSGMKMWWGGEKPVDTELPQEEIEVKLEDTTDGSQEKIEEVESQEVSAQSEEELKKAINAAKEWGSYFFTVSKKATQVAAKHVTSTAKQFKEQVGETSILEKTPVIGEFNREQSKFIETQRTRSQKAEAAVPPWVGYSPQEEAALKTQILDLSQDERNFLRNPPSGARFDFDFEADFPVAMALLQEDSNLGGMRFKLVPKKIKEEFFWRNYFYRISLIKQSAQLTSLVQNAGNKREVDANQKSDTSTESYDRLSDFEDPKSSGNTSSPRERPRVVSESETPAEQDFVSDGLDNASGAGRLSEEERLALGMDGGEALEKKDTEGEGSLDEWEQELQRELKEFELVAGDKADTEHQDPDTLQDDELEREIMAQLEQEN